MKIGILTFHFARNYGAVLQCYALQESLREACGDTVVIDYRPHTVASNYKIFDVHRFWGRTPSKFLHKTRHEIEVLPTRRRRFHAFEKFLEDHISLSGDISGCERVIVGSDQVWNTRITKGFDPLYWGNRIEAPVFSYAASVGNAEEKDLHQAVELLKKNFRAISLREASDIIPGRTDVDPCFLPDISLWNALADESLLDTSEPYVLLYIVKPSSEAHSYAESEARTRGLRLLILSAKIEMVNSPEVAAASPADFVKLVRDASLVVTTSFHGTAFSIIFGKEFKSFCADNRILGLLDSSEPMSERIARSKEYIKEIVR